MIPARPGERAPPLNHRQGVKSYIATGGKTLYAVRRGVATSRFAVRPAASRGPCEGEVA